MPALRHIPKIIEFLGYDPRPPAKADSLAEQLVAYRHKFGLTHSRLAEMLGVDKCTISSWECGLSTPPKAYLERIRNLLDLPNANYDPELYKGPKKDDTTSFQVF